MKRARIRLPHQISSPTIFEFARDLDSLYQHDEVTVDFSGCEFFTPYGMLFMAAKLRSFQARSPDLKIAFAGYREHQYPAHMGFFRMFGFEYGRDLGEAAGGHDYLPLTSVDRADLYEAAGDRFTELPDLIQRHADRIADVIARSKEKNGPLFDALSYSVREVIRNVFEHSQANTVYYGAQYWPKSNKVEFAVADLGVGVRRGLGENPNFRFRTDKEAIEYSLLPSVSGKTHLPRTSDVWFNSGYGLYMTSRLARNGGNFVIASGDMAIHLSRMTKRNYRTSFPGTALRFNLDVSEIGDVQARLNQFRKEGADIAETIAGSGNRPPSAMSLLLRRDYSNRIT